MRGLESASSRLLPPVDLTAAGTHEPDPEYVAFVGGDSDEVMSWARSVRLEDGSTRYDEVWLDANKIPHLTGRTVPISRYHIVPAVIWLHPAPSPREVEQEDDHDAPPGLAPSAHAGVVRIAGTEDTAYSP